jgi:hypothetical protein
MYLDTKKDKRHLVLDQSINEYMRLKEINPKCTRIWNSGILNLDK